jgi:hypothetical protein
MAPKKEGGRTRREAGAAGQGERRKAGPAVEGDAGQGRGAVVVDFDFDFDLWGAFFGELWGEGAGGGSADERPGDGRKAGEGTRARARGRRPRNPAGEGAFLRGRPQDRGTEGTTFVPNAGLPSRSPSAKPLIHRRPVRTRVASAGTVRPTR